MSTYLLIVHKAKRIRWLQFIHLYYPIKFNEKDKTVSNSALQSLEQIKLGSLGEFLINLVIF